MNDKQKQNIARGLALTAEVCGSQLSEGAITIMAEELASYEEEEVSTALKRVMREHTGRLSLAVIIERLEEGKGLGADAAWELAVRSRIYDNAITLVIPQAIIQAWPYALWEAGDKQGARMAFKSAYPERLAQYGDEVFMSLGWDSEGRRTAIEEAVRNGVITQARANALLPERKQQRKLEDQATAKALTEETRRLDENYQEPR